MDKNLSDKIKRVCIEKGRPELGELIERMVSTVTSFREDEGYKNPKDKKDMALVYACDSIEQAIVDCTILAMMKEDCECDLTDDEMYALTTI